ncbi:MAG: XTP/dITP diphosphatase [Candidatus Afipia apatlaquensis]|uniref:dITP/XTP pyrophosphatase n=1 Tax=Candidatus Afipia apatlaquensis TaxID=2712852 RepID=A0A7C9VNI6_9BRAD|nr:XTP/dITP diphosphatase [Candidatus Afipia apatlaquensis]
MTKIVIATQNENKVEEIKQMLEGTCIEAVSLRELKISVDVVEDGKTFEENAYKKAFEIMKITGMPTLADDSGLQVYALNGAPGVYSARFAGAHGDYLRNNQKLLELMKDVPDGKRGARFVTVMVLLYPDMKKITARGEIEGYIGHELKGINGFGFDPLFMVPELKKSFAELDSSEKNSISHRGRALRAMREKLLSSSSL